MVNTMIAQIVRHAYQLGFGGRAIAGYIKAGGIVFKAHPAAEHSYLLWRLNMKRLVLLSLLAGLSLGAAAQSSPDNLGSVKIPLPPSSITLPEHASRIYPGGFDTLVGVYNMSNGELMRLSMRGIRKYAEVGKLPKTEVIATNDYEFVGVDRSFKINLSEPLFGYVKGSVLIAVPPRLAGEPAGVQYLSLAAQ
jgi:hypothetical protein